MITIIILLILAGVTLNTALSENGLFKKAKYAAEEYNKKAIEEEIQLLLAEGVMESVSNGTNQKGDITSVLEKVKGTDGEITEQDIQEFNDEYLKDYDEKIEAVKPDTDLGTLDPDGFYVQTEDITEEKTLNTPIGTEDTPFTGVYNGNGHTINSLTIKGTGDNTGMFGVNEGTVKDVTIDSCTVTSDYSRVGAIAGTNNGVIENCDIKDGKVSSTDYETFHGAIGGICGDNNGIVRNCINGASVDCSGRYFGGITGGNGSNGVIDHCVNTGKITGIHSGGGISGFTYR